MDKSSNHSRCVPPNLRLRPYDRPAGRCFEGPWGGEYCIHCLSAVCNITPAQEITSIAVHHTHPYMFLTTSRDQTVRLYDLRFRPRQLPNNMYWPLSKHASLAGAGFGLHMNDSEGEGYGRCLAVLVGGRSGGHQAAVLHAVRGHYNTTNRIRS